MSTGDQHAGCLRENTSCLFGISFSFFCLFLRAGMIGMIPIHCASLHASRTCTFCAHVTLYIVMLSCYHVVGIT